MMTGALVIRKIKMLLLILVPLTCRACKIQDFSFGNTGHEWNHPNEIVVGGIVSYSEVFLPDIYFRRDPARVPSGIPVVVVKFYQHILALVFAIREINKNPQILTNITLGFHICDTYYDARLTYHAALNLLFKSQQVVPNYRCDTQKNLIGTIGGQTFHASSQIADILSLYKIPQFSYGSFQPEINRKPTSPSLYHMFPNEAIQYHGIVQLLLHFRWKWVGLMTLDDESGEYFLKTLELLLSGKGICSAFTSRVPRTLPISNIIDTYRYILNSVPVVMMSKANAVVLYGDIAVIRWLTAIEWGVQLTEMAAGGKVWIITAQIDFALNMIHKMWDIQFFHGAISFSVHSGELLGFQQFLRSINPYKEKDNGFITDFWEQAFDCFMPGSPEATDNSSTCNGGEKLETLPGPFFEMTMTSLSYNIYNAVYTLANALNAYLSMARSKGQEDGRRQGLLNVEAWQLHSWLRRISFNNSAGREITFNENGELISGLDVTNLITFPNGSYTRVKVGKVDSQVPPDKMFSINEERLQWHKELIQVPPLSLCNDNCHPGYRKKKKEGKKFCCYDCVSCPDRMFSNQKDVDNCARCPEDSIPNKEQNQCIRKIPEFLSFGDPLGIPLSALAIFFSLLTTLVFGIIIKYRNTPIVKASNKDFTYILLVSLFFCFICSLMFIGEPTKVTCILRQPGFVLVFSVAVSSVLAKTITVVAAFTAAKPGNMFQKCIGKGFGNLIVLFCSVLQMGISAAWLAMSPPYPDVNFYTISDKFVIECNEGSIIMFYCALGYMGALALFTLIVAFLARKLPDSFNEAKFIAFSMLVFCSVWLSFVPTYVSTTGKYTVAVEVFSILASSTGLLLCIFCPKCYIIVLRPDLNKKEQIKKRRD